ncbi:hypothetical protein KP509_1Z002500 [Ceratopteris richardii]|nr:hypothetical protein KP509_1Z002500 [Ceratopteris richardii]
MSSSTRILCLFLRFLLPTAVYILPPPPPLLSPDSVPLRTQFHPKHATTF